MTISHRRSLTCPHCKTESPFTVYESVNVTENPELKATLLDGDLWTHKCPSCGVEALVSSPILYHDMGEHPQDDTGKTMMLMLSFDDEFDAAGLDAPLAEMPFLAEFAAKQKTRLVRSHNEFLEKIRIHDDGLDDRTIEVVKAMLRRQSPEFTDRELLFDGRGDDGSIRFVALAGKEPAGLAIPSDYCDAMQASLQSSGLLDALASVRWARVGREFGDQLASKMDE